MVNTSRKIVRHKDSLTTATTTIEAPVIAETTVSIPVETTVSAPPIETTTLQIGDIVSPILPENVIPTVVILEPASVTTESPLEEKPLEHTPSPIIPPIPEYSEEELQKSAEHLKKPEDRIPEVVKVKEVVVRPSPPKRRDLYPPIPLKFWERA